MDQQRSPVRVGNSPGERDWRNVTDVPRPHVYSPREELIGKIVTPHRCPEEGKHLPSNMHCICAFIGKAVKISGVKLGETGMAYYSFVGGNDKVMYEPSFSEELRGLDFSEMPGYILENSEGKFLNAAFIWAPVAELRAGYIYNKEVLRGLLFPDGRPTKAYPAIYNYKTHKKRITGPPIPFADLKL